jgi:hypothetical protein
VRAYMVGGCEVIIRVMRVNWRCEGVGVKSGGCKRWTINVLGLRVVYRRNSMSIDTFSLFTCRLEHDILRRTSPRWFWCRNILSMDANGHV